MIKQYKLRDINRNDTLHKEIFVKRDDCFELLEIIINSAVEAGADKDKLLEVTKSE